MSWGTPYSSDASGDSEAASDKESAASMSAAELHQRLVHVLMYRDLCRAVQRSGRENFVFALIMAFFAFLSQKNGGNDLILAIYAFFILGELLIAFYKWFFPSAEGVLCDALILLAFALLNGMIAYLKFQVGFGPDPILAFLIGLFLLSAWRQWQSYRNLRELFRIRPNRAQLRWFERFLQDIRHGDPHTDPTIVDLPTRPPWKAALLGDLVVAVGRKDRQVALSHYGDFLLFPVEDNSGEKHDWVQLYLNGEMSPPFPIEPASWDNYRRWQREREAAARRGEGGEQE
ncbi:MAG: hypothetical protein WHU94_07455 [Thermogemmata sp.]|jgi:hypothetical protein|nr:hypothetical protein [Gemmataceae bacterium]